LKFCRRMDEKELHSNFQLHTNGLLSISKKIEERLKILEEKEKHIKLLERRMNESAEKAKTKIKLDVGGKIFSTSKTTLLQHQGTYFYALLASDHWQPDEDGCYFIDRNPKHFDRILDYLRTGEFNTKGLDEEAMKKLKTDLDYYQVTPPKPLIEPQSWNPNVKGNFITLTNNNKVATKTQGGNSWDAAVLGTQPNQNFKVKVLNRGPNGDFMIGMASTIQQNSSNYNARGWYLYGSNGTLYSQQGDSSRYYCGNGLNNGSVIEVLFDQTAKTISFAIDGVGKGVAFSNIPNGDIYPALDMYDQSSSLEILS